MKIKRIIGFAFATTLLFGALTALSFAQQQNEIAVEEAKAWNLDVQPNITTDYYSSCDGKTGSALKTALAAINKPQNKSYDWSRYEAADEAQDDSSSILCLYTRHNIGKSSHCGSYAWDKWNREHVYPQGTFTLSTTDNHNIFACEGQINNTRGNKSFAEVGGTPISEFGHTTQCYTNSSYFEPCDDAKGEVARACMYCTIYYGYDLADIFDSISTALKWHAQHPVTAREIYRNNVVYGLQGNRNPFVDHPSYANTIWNTSYTYSDPDPVGGEAADPVAVTGVSLNKTSLNLEVGQSETLTATVSPNNATNKKVTWSTSNSSVATVNNGAVTAVGEGTATIKVTTSDGGFTASCIVTVTPKPKYTISFNANGGTGNMESISKEAGSYTLPVNGFTAPENQEFAGWKVNNTGSLLQPGASITISESTTIYAQWKDITYTVTFNSDGGSPVNSQNIVKGQLATKPADPTRTGYTFLGWFLGENEYNFATPITGDITLVAKWQKDGGGEKQIFTVSFNSNGGSQVDPQQVEEEQKVTKPADPTRDGYDFVGWYVGDTLYDFNTPVSRDFTLFAHWIEKSGGDDPVVVAKLDTSKPLLITAPNKTKYSVGEEIDLNGFKAVATYEDGSNKDVTNSVVLDSINMDKAGEKIVTLSYTENGRTVRGLFNISVEASSGGGCHGSIIASSAIISLTSLLGVGLLLIKKKK